MREGIRCRIKFYFLLCLFFAPVGVGEWRRGVIAWSDVPHSTPPVPGLQALALRSAAEADADDERDRSVSTASADPTPTVSAQDP